MQTPTYQKHKDAEVAVLFIHGFMGGPNQFADLEEAVYGVGCTCVSVLLPGHGGGVCEFVKSGVDDWQRHVQDEIDKIKRDHKKIILVGHSMGGLLALNASLVKENPIAAVVLLSTPLKIYLLNLRSLRFKLRLLRFPKDNAVRAAYIKSNSITLSKLFFYPSLIKPVVQLYRLIRRTRKHLSDVFVPVYMFHSKNDETTAYQSAALLYEGLCNTQKTAFALDKSWHAFYSADERKLIQDQLLRLVEQIGTRNELK